MNDIYHQKIYKIIVLKINFFKENKEIISKHFLDLYQVNYKDPKISFIIKKINIMLIQV